MDAWTCISDLCTAWRAISYVPEFPFMHVLQEMYIRPGILFYVILLSFLVCMFGHVYQAPVQTGMLFYDLSFHLCMDVWPCMSGTCTSGHVISCLLLEFPHMHVL
jgi:hypothetical protein